MGMLLNSYVEWHEGIPLQFLKHQVTSILNKPWFSMVYPLLFKRGNAILISYHKPFMFLEALYPCEMAAKKYAYSHVHAKIEYLCFG
jgi:hypothetical protein